MTDPVAHNGTARRTKPRLKPAIAEQLDCGSPDIVWLRDTFGITSEEVDHARGDEYSDAMRCRRP